MIKKLLFCVLTIVVIAAKAQVPSFPSPYVVPNIDWIKYYSQTDGISSAPTALDANSNVYTTGYTGISPASDILILKYDSTGVQKYAYPYNGGGFDVANAIKVDASGNAFIAGITTATTGTTGRNYIMIKVNSVGAFQWAKFYDRTVSKDDEANDLAIDASGDIYVTGRSKNASNNWDIVTVKLSGSTGNQLWSHVYSGSGLDDVGTGIVVSPNGSYVYVTGNTDNSTTGTNIVTYALNAGTGTNYWTSPVITNGTSNSTDKSNGIIMLGSNVMICGEKTNVTTGLDYTTIKYDGSNGNILWQKHYDIGNTTNRATALVRDSSGNVGVVGTVLNGSIYEYHTVLYSPLGTQYAVNIESTGLGTLTVDPSICNDTIAHHWYIAGEKQKSTKDIFVYQIVPSGNTSWRQYIDGQNNNIDAGTAIAVNGVGVVYVGGLSKNSSANYDYTTIKLNQTPLYWPPDYNNSSANYNHLYFPNKGQIMRTDGVLGTEMKYYTHNTTPAVFIEQKGFDLIYKKVDTVQTVLDTIERIQCEFLGRNVNAAFQEYLPKGPIHNYYLGYAAAASIENVRGNERIFIPNYFPYIDLHYFSGPGGIKYYFVVKPGALLDNVLMKIDGANSTAIDGTTGRLKINGKYGKIELNKPIAYTTNTAGAVVAIAGSASWSSAGTNTYKILPPSYSATLPLIIQVSAAQTGTIGSPNITNTNLDYSTYYGAQDNDVFTDVKALGNGKRFVTGYTSAGTFPAVNSVNYYSGNFDAVILKYTADDTLRFATFQGGEASDMSAAIAVDGFENVYIGGATTSTNMLGFNVSGATNQFNNGGAVGFFKQDGFLAKLSGSTGTLLWRRYFGGSSSDAVTNLYIDGYNSLYVSGYSYSTNFPVVNAYQASGCATTVANPANRDAIFGKFNASLVAQWITYYGGSANVTSGTETQDSGNDIVVDNNLNVIGCGYTDATNFPITNTTGQTGTFYKSTISGQSDGFLVRFNSSGTPDFSSYFGGSNSDGMTRLVYKSNVNELYFAGQGFKGTGFPFFSKAGAFNSQYSFGGSTAFVGYLDGNLNQKWCTYWGKGEANPKGFNVNGLSVDDQGLVYLSGWTTSDTLTYPATTATTIVYRDSTRSGEDGFMAIFNQGKNLYHAHYFGGISNDRINNSDVANLYSSQKLYITGVSSSTNFPVSWNSANAGLIDSTYSAGDDGFISRFDLEHYQVTGIKQVDFDKSMLLLYPNPTNTEFYLEIEGVLNSKPTAKVYNLMGQLIFEQKIDNAKTKINCDSWPNGVYLINISNNETQTTFKLIKN